MLLKTKLSGQSMTPLLYGLLGSQKKKKNLIVENMLLAK